MSSLIINISTPKRVTIIETPDPENSRSSITHLPDEQQKLLFSKTKIHLKKQTAKMSTSYSWYLIQKLNVSGWIPVPRVISLEAKRVKGSQKHQYMLTEKTVIENCRDYTENALTLIRKLAVLGTVSTSKVFKF